MMSCRVLGLRPPSAAMWRCQRSSLCQPHGAVQPEQGTVREHSLCRHNVGWSFAQTGLATCCMQWHRCFLNLPLH